jgi:ribosomal protein L34
MKRMRTRSGRAILAARRRKGRHSLSVSTEHKPTQKK